MHVLLAALNSFILYLGEEMPSSFTASSELDSGERAASGFERSAEGA
jgi:hypothetical protein